MQGSPFGSSSLIPLQVTLTELMVGREYPGKSRRTSVFYPPEHHRPGLTVIQNFLGILTHLVFQMNVRTH